MRMAFTVAAIVAAGFWSIAAQAQIGNNTSVLNPDTASEAELAALPQLGDDLAAAITAERPFADMLELDALLAPSLSAEERADLYVVLFLPINLNTATPEEIQLVPGMSDRMVREFEEYRPYTAIEQFRREIGKYVGNEAVAEFEQYVFVPLDLNSATAEELAAIPAIATDTVDAIVANRPYESVDAFREAVGPTVGEDQLALIDRYLTVR